MRKLVAMPITADAFAPYGDLLRAPETYGRTYFDSGLANFRSDAACSLSVSHVKPAAAGPVIATQMERHEFSSQSFLPIDATRYLVMVAPHHETGGPDMSLASAFIVDGGDGITYAANTWHHPLVVLDAPARFGVVMWRDGGSGDEQFVTIDAPLQIEIPSK